MEFPEIAQFNVTHFGLFFALLKTRFPRFTRPISQARLPPNIESFPKLPVRPGALAILPGGTPERVWYVSADESEIAQLQSDRLTYNWRAKSGPYGSYAENADSFRKLYDLMVGFCSEYALDTPKPHLCEVTYVNHITLGGKEPIDVFAHSLSLDWKFSDSFLPKPELASFNRAFIIPDRRGRLYAEASIARNLESNQDFVLLNMTARVVLESSGVNAMFGALDLAHKWVVHGFASVTSPAMHAEWGRQL